MNFTIGESMENYGTPNAVTTHLVLEAPIKLAQDDGNSLESCKISRLLCSLVLHVRNTLQGPAQTSAHEMLPYNLVSTTDLLSLLWAAIAFIHSFVQATNIYCVLLCTRNCLGPEIQQWIIKSLLLGTYIQMERGREYQTNKCVMCQVVVAPLKKNKTA